MGLSNSLCSKKSKNTNFEEVLLPKVTDDDFPMHFSVVVKYFRGIELKNSNVSLHLDFFGQK